jgi:hypothetical protein
VRRAVHTFIPALLTERGPGYPAQSRIRSLMPGAESGRLALTLVAPVPTVRSLARLAARRGSNDQESRHKDRDGQLPRSRHLGEAIMAPMEPPSLFLSFGPGVLDSRCLPFFGWGISGNPKPRPRPKHLMGCRGPSSPIARTPRCCSGPSLRATHQATAGGSLCTWKPEELQSHAVLVLSCGVGCIQRWKGCR